MPSLTAILVALVAGSIGIGIGRLFYVIVDKLDWKGWYVDD